MEHIVIIGNGIAGITAARHIRKLSDRKITIVSAETDYFFSRTALMYVYMGHMRWTDIKPYEDWFWEKNRLELIKAYVERIDTDAQTLHFTQGETLTYDKLIIATGSVTNFFGWEGLALDGVQGLVSKQDLEKLEINAPNKEICSSAVIVGGGLIGVEMAEMLRTRDIDVTMLVREDAFWNNVLPNGEAEMISRHIRSHGIDLRHNTNLNKILADADGRVRAVLAQEGGEEIPCKIVGITTGVKPNIPFLKHSAVETDKGILVNRMLETNVKDVLCHRRLCPTPRTYRSPASRGSGMVYRKDYGRDLAHRRFAVIRRIQSRELVQQCQVFRYRIPDLRMGISRETKKALRSPFPLET